MAEDKILIQALIDLEDSTRSLLAISESLFVDFPPRESGSFIGKFFNNLSMKRSQKEVSIGLRDIKADRHIKFAQGKSVKDLFSLVIEGNKFGVNEMPVRIMLSKERTPFQLYFNPKYITDIGAVQGKVKEEEESYKVTGTAFITNEKGEELDYQNFEVEIRVKDLKALVSSELKVKGRLEYKDLPDHRIVSIGKLHLRNDQMFERTPEIIFNGKLSLLNNRGQEIPPLKDKNEDPQPRIFFKETSSPSIFLDKVRSPKVIIDGENTYRPEEREIMVNLSGIPNPMEAFENFTIRLDGSWAYAATPLVPNFLQASKEFRLKKDSQGTELRVTNNGNLLTSNHEVRLDEFQFTPGGAFRDEVVIDLANIATDSSRGGTLRIKKPRISSAVSEDGIKIYNGQNRESDLTKVVKLEGDLIDELEERNFIDIPNGPEAKEKIKIMYDPAEIFSINNGGQYRFTINTVVDIEYQENNDGRNWTDVEIKTFRILLTRPMFILPFPDWLAVDYGSSAIVSLYKNDLLNLNQRRKDILATLSAEKDWNLASSINSNETEKDTKFISSDLLLHPVIQKDKEHPVSMLLGEQTQEQLNYSNTAVCLAPTNALRQTYHLTMLPCLKLLVGNKWIPQNPDYDNFKYYRKTPNDLVTEIDIKKSKEEDEPNSLASVNNLFDEAYKVVFRYYLSSLIPNIHRVNRLVLTYPNSYTPAHLKVLRQIAQDTFRYLREGQLHFVSESDAVAAYYMDHWSEYNSTSSETWKEDILVYDMGAGTLDLTYLTKTYDSKTGEFNLEIKGKLGVSKAGNYLDYVLASIIAEAGGRSMRLLAGTERPSGTQADTLAKGRVELKEFVKNTLKPRLSDDDTSQSFTFTYAGVEVTISINDILNNKLFKKYLTEVTTDILKSMSKYLDSKFEIDTVILSGRSVRMKPLKEALEKAAANYRGPSGKIEFKDLDINGEQDRQKTAVVEGAVKYAGSFNTENSKVKISSRRLYASFGVAFKRLGGEMDYVELADHADMPSLTERGSKEFATHKISGLSHTDEIRLIQTYLPPKETLEALKKNDFEFISEMNNFNLEPFHGEDTLDMHLSVDRHNQVSLYIEGRPTSGTSPKGVDLNNILTRRSIWPATI